MDIGSLLSQIDFGTYWGIFFIGVVIATIAMSTGVDGAIFWAPVLLLLYGVEPAAAVACAIFIELFGFGSGLYGYTKRKKVLFKQGAFLLMFTIPLGVLGAYISKVLPINFLITVIAIICLILAFSNFRRAELEDHHKERCIKNPALKHKKLGGFLTSIGGFFAGAIGVGIGETNNYYLLIKNKYPATFATGTTIFIIAVTDLFCSLFNFLYFKKLGSSFDWVQIASILIFAIPAVVIGARLGVVLAHRIKRKHFDYLLAAVFSVMAVISFYRVSVSIDYEMVMASIINIFR